MKLQWFPGHMKKSLNELSASLKQIDMVLVVLDARAPYSCINPAIENIVQSKTVCYLLNKTDLANVTTTKDWIKYFESKGKLVAEIDATKKSSVKVVENLINREIRKREQEKNRRILTKFRVAIVGVPNTGKSTLLNTLAGQTMSKTGNIAGITKGSHWIRLTDRIDLMDNAGTLYPKFSDEKTAENLAILGSLNDAVVDENELAFVLLNKLKSIAPNKLIERYSLDCVYENTYELFLAIGKSRGFIVKGGEIDEERTAKAIIDDYRKTRIGKISLESVGNRI